PPSATVVATPLPAPTVESPASLATQIASAKPAKPSPVEFGTSAISKPTTELEPVQPQPMLVKKDLPHATSAKAADIEVPEAPGVLGLGGSSDQNAITGIVASTPVAVPTAAAHTVKVSQGVSQGLITRRVQPI